MKTPAKFAGRWRIVEMEQWERNALDENEPAHIEFGSHSGGTFGFLYVFGDMDCRFEGDRVEFSWVGHDEMDEASGRGWAQIDGDGKLHGHIFFHDGDDSSFVARKSASSHRGQRRARRGR